MLRSRLSARLQPGSFAEGTSLHVGLHLTLASHGACCKLLALAAAGHSLCSCRSQLHT